MMMKHVLSFALLGLGVAALVGQFETSGHDRHQHGTATVPAAQGETADKVGHNH